jgi:protease I
MKFDWRSDTIIIYNPSSWISACVGGLVAKIAMIVAPAGFRDEECLEPKEIFEGAGVEVVIVSKGTGTARGKLGAELPIDKDISEINAADYDAIVFVGGPGASQYFNYPLALKLAKDAFDGGKIVAAICIAPSILANAGILKGKKVTAFISEEENLEAHGARFTGKSVEQYGKIITANGPGAAKEFGKLILKNLK